MGRKKRSAIGRGADTGTLCDGDSDTTRRGRLGHWDGRSKEGKNGENKRV